MDNISGHASNDDIPLSLLFGSAKKRKRNVLEESASNSIKRNEEKDEVQKLAPRRSRPSEGSYAESIQSQSYFYMYDFDFGEKNPKPKSNTRKINSNELLNDDNTPIKQLFLGKRYTPQTSTSTLVQISSTGSSEKEGNKPKTKERRARKKLLRYPNNTAQSTVTPRSPKTKVGKKRLGRPPKKLGRPPKQLDRSPKKVGRPPKKVGRPPKKAGRPPKQLGRPPKKLGRPPRKVGRPPKKKPSQIAELIVAPEAEAEDVAVAVAVAEIEMISSEDDDEKDESYNNDDGNQSTNRNYDRPSTGEKGLKQQPRRRGRSEQRKQEPWMISSKQHHEEKPPSKLNDDGISSSHSIAVFPSEVQRDCFGAKDPGTDFVEPKTNKKRGRKAKKSSKKALQNDKIIEPGIVKPKRKRGRPRKDAMLMVVVEGEQICESKITQIEKLKGPKPKAESKLKSTSSTRALMSPDGQVVEPEPAKPKKKRGRSIKVKRDDVKEVELVVEPDLQAVKPKKRGKNPKAELKNTVRSEQDLNAVPDVSVVLKKGGSRKSTTIMSPRSDVNTASSSKEPKKSPPSKESASANLLSSDLPMIQKLYKHPNGLRGILLEDKFCRMNHIHGSDSQIVLKVLKPLCFGKLPNVVRNESKLKWFLIKDWFKIENV